MKKFFLWVWLAVVGAVFAFSGGWSSAFAQQQPTVPPEWVTVPHEKLVRSDARFFYARGEAQMENGDREAALERAKQQAQAEFAQLVGTHIDAILKAGAEQVSITDPETGEATIIEVAKSEDFFQAAASVMLRGAEVLAEWPGTNDPVTADGQVGVIMRAPRELLPEFLDAVPAWSVPDDAYPVKDRTAETVKVSADATQEVRVDDVFEVLGWGPELPVSRSFGTGRLYEVNGDGSLLQLTDGTQLPGADKLWARYRGEVGVGIGVRANFHTVDAGAFSGFGLNYAAVSTGLSVSLPIEWNFGRYLGISEFWLAAEPAMMPTIAPVTSFGFDVGVVKRFRLRQFTLGLAASFLVRWHELDVRGSTILINGAPPNALNQVIVGAAVMAEFAWDFLVDWSLMLRVGWRFIESSGIWSQSGSNFNLGYTFDESGLIAGLTVRVRF